MFTLSDRDLDPALLGRAMAHPRAGALATFEGWVRNHHAGRGVLRLTYEAYDRLAIKEGDRVLAGARTRFDILDARCVHRIGPLDVGGLAIWIGVTAEHRAPALDACAFIIDAIKATVPVWKKEFYTDGSTAWVNCAHESSGAERK